MFLKTYQLMEQFDSIQGEGYNAGRWMHFIRFAMCNLNCDFCDTTWKPPRIAIEHADLVYSTKLRGPAAICFTGGEPAIQMTLELCQEFKKAGIYLAMETNGTFWNECMTTLDHIAISPKAGKPLHEDLINWLYHGARIENQTAELRFIVDSKDTIVPNIEFPHTHLYVSPKFDMRNIYPACLKRALEIVEEKPRYRLSVQTHKLIGVR